MSANLKDETQSGYFALVGRTSKDGSAKMKEESNNEKSLIQYLLGNLPEEQRLQIEREYFSDDQSYERLLALENELLYDYAQNILSPGEREQFGKRFLSSERNKKIAMVASALSHQMLKAQPDKIIDKDIAARDPQFLWQHLKSFFIAQNAAMKLSLAAFVVVSLVLIWLVIGMVRLRNEFNQSKAQWDIQKDRLRRQAQQESARVDELNLMLSRKIDENAALRQGSNRTWERRESLPTVISLLLAPSSVRDQEHLIKKLYLPPSARLLKLRLKLKEKVNYKSYQVTLLTVEGAERWSRDKLYAQGTGSRRSIDLSLPAEFLEEGDYELRLKGDLADGTPEETKNYYYLSVRRK
ncbi:MAG: hypothetical protein J2P21_00510 [Chloracidobacterium sp.]|nr:hypothetical protein [Chloracidobacterium sp.]